MPDTFKKWPSDVFEKEARVSGKLRNSVSVGGHHVCTTSYSGVSWEDREAAAEYISVCLNLGKELLRLKRERNGQVVSQVDVFKGLLEENERLRAELQRVRCSNGF